VTTNRTLQLLQPTTAKLDISSTMVATNILKMPQVEEHFLFVRPIFPFPAHLITKSRAHEDLSVECNVLGS
jgi:hypothetical protein